MKTLALALTLATLLALPVAASPAQQVQQQAQQDSKGIAALLKRTAHKPIAGLKVEHMAYPVAKVDITSGFGKRMHPVLKREIMHQGIDFKLPTRSPVMAAADGTIVYAGWYGGYGKVVILDHGNGLTSVYAHLADYEGHAGDEVAARQVIARSGDTGNSSEPHLHFELRQGGTAIDPARFLPSGR